MVSFELYLKERGEELESIVYRTFEENNAYSLFLKVEKEFSAYSVRGGKENQPFLYMRIHPIKDDAADLYGNPWVFYFHVEVKDQMIEFIEANLES